MILRLIGNREQRLPRVRRPAIEFVGELRSRLAERRDSGRRPPGQSFADWCGFGLGFAEPQLADAALLGSHMDAVLFVVDSSKSHGRMAARAIELLRGSGAPVVGTVLNRVSHRAMRYVGYTTEYYAPHDGTTRIEAPAAVTEERVEAVSRVETGLAPISVDQEASPKQVDVVRYVGAALVVNELLGLLDQPKGRHGRPPA